MISSSSPIPPILENGTQAKDPFNVLLKRELRSHFISCSFAFLILVGFKYQTIRSAPPDAILLTTSGMSLIWDFLVSVLILTFFRVLYSIPLWFARPNIRRVGTWILFTLVFGTFLKQQTNQAVGMRKEKQSIQFFYPFPKKEIVVPVAELPPPTLKQTPVVSFIKFPETDYRFAPVSRFDKEGQENMRLLFKSLTDDQVK